MNAVDTGTREIEGCHRLGIILQTYQTATTVSRCELPIVEGTRIVTAYRGHCRDVGETRRSFHRIRLDRHNVLSYQRRRNQPKDQSALNTPASNAHNADLSFPSETRLSGSLRLF